MRFFLFTIVLLVLVFEGNAQSKVTTKSGLWSDATVWSPSGVPTSTNNVTILATHMVSVDASYSCNLLTVNSTGTVTYIGNVTRSLTVLSDLTVNGTFSVLISSNATHQLNVGGNLVNNGSLQLNTDAGSRANLNFNKNGSQTFSGTGALTSLYKISLNMGTSSLNVMDVSVSNFSIASNFLTLTNGTFKFSTSHLGNLVPFTAATTVAATSGIWLNSSLAALNFSATLNIAGLMRLTSGTINIGNGNNEDFVSNGGTLIVEGGILNIAGNFDCSTGANTFSLTGGTIKLPSYTSTDALIAPFQFSGTGSQFNMTGGTFVVRREGGAGGQNLGFVVGAGLGGTITGGTLQIGETGSPATQSISINSGVTIPNLVVSIASGTAWVTGNPLTVSGDVVISAGALNTQTSLTVNGNWTNSGTLTPNTNTINFVSNSAQSISRTGTETFYNVNFSGTGIKTFGSPATFSGNVSIAASTTVDVSSSNHSLTLRGNLSHIGTLESRSGLLTLGGTAAQNITGTNPLNLYDVTVTNSVGVTLSNSVNIGNTLLLTPGIINAGTQYLTIKSTSLSTGRIGQVTGVGNITGSLTIERFIPGGYTGWALIGSPVSNTLTFSDLDDDTYITCAACPDGYNNFISVYSYDETQSGTYDAGASYVGITNITNNFPQGKGYWMYLGNAQYTTTGISLDVTGALRKGSYTITLNRTNFGSPANDGWNLIHNPYPGALSWSLLRNGNANVDNAIYVYNADLNSGSGAYATYVNGVSSPAVASGGIGNDIPMMQGFYVHATAATSLVAQESYKVVTDPTLLRPAASPPVIRFNLSGQNYSDETVLYFQSNATNSFDISYDAIKMRGQDPFAPTIALTEASDVFQINGVPPLNGTYTTNVQTLTGYSGVYKISSLGLATLPMGTCVNLFDKATNTVHNLAASDYTFFLADTTAAPRFVLTITSNQLNVTMNVVQPDCSAPSGSLLASPAGNGPWNYFWKVNGFNSKTTLNTNTTDTLNNVSGGLVELQVFTSGACDNYSNDFQMVPVDFAIPAFTAPDTVSVVEMVQLINYSQNAIAYDWNFGDGSGTSTLEHPWYKYNLPGTYTVTLKVSSDTGCDSILSKRIVVKADETGLSQTIAQNKTILFKTVSSKEFELSTLNNETFSQVRLHDAQGRVVFEKEMDEVQLLSLDFNQFAQGIYFLECKVSNELYTRKISLQ